MTVTGTAQLELDHRTVGEVMRLGVVTCMPDAPLPEVAHLMSAYRIHCVVVEGCGVVSDLDLVRALASGEETTAGKVAATEPVTASPYDTLADVAQVMADHDVVHLVVVDGKSAEPMGVISTLDLARAFAGEA